MIPKLPTLAGGKRQNGATLVFLSIMILPLIILLALSIDGFILVTSKLEQDHNAEYAALTALSLSVNAATGEVQQPLIPAAIQKAEIIAGRNRYLGNRAEAQVHQGDLQSGTAGAVQFGYYQKNARTFVTNGNCGPNGLITYNGVRVSLSTRAANLSHKSSRLKALFSSALGYREFDSRARAIAYWDKERALKSFALKDTATTSRAASLDVNGDTIINTDDAQLIKNFLNLSGSGSAAGTCFDVNGDGYISPQDLLLVINHLNLNQINNDNLH